MPHSCIEFTSNFLSCCCYCCTQILNVFSPLLLECFANTFIIVVVVSVFARTIIFCFFIFPLDFVILQILRETNISCCSAWLWFLLLFFVVSKHFASFGEALRHCCCSCSSALSFHKVSHFTKSYKCCISPEASTAGPFYDHILRFMPACGCSCISVYSHANKWCANTLRLQKDIRYYMYRYLLLMADGGIFLRNICEKYFLYINISSISTGTYLFNIYIVNHIDILNRKTAAGSYSNYKKYSIVSNWNLYCLSFIFYEVVFFEWTLG